MPTGGGSIEGIIMTENENEKKYSYSPMILTEKINQSNLLYLILKKKD